MAGKSDAHSIAILGLLRGVAPSTPSNTYVSLFDGTPDDNSNNYTLETNGGNGRQVISWNPADQAPSTGDGRAIITNAALTWTGWTGGPNTLTYFGIYDSASEGAGTMLYSGQLDNNVTMNNGETATFATGDLEVIED